MESPAHCDFDSESDISIPDDALANMSCQSSDFEGGEEELEAAARAPVAAAGIQPYQFEPDASSDEGNDRSQ